MPATQQIISQFTCPGCSAILMPTGHGATRCLSCGWRGEAYLFTPSMIVASGAEAALPDDATCIHHPSKKATAVCSGTGDYVCSLCAVDINGQTYSAEYLNGAGKATVGKAFDRRLRRPDSQARLYMVLFLIPYANVVGAFLIPHGFILYARALRLRREDELFARLMSKTSVVLLPILLSLIGLFWIFIIVVLTMTILRQVQ